MRIVLNRKQLLGFANVSEANAVPVNAAKVGNKTFTVRVASADHADLDRTLSTVEQRQLAFPAGQ